MLHGAERRVQRANLARLRCSIATAQRRLATGEELLAHLLQRGQRRGRGRLAQLRGGELEVSRPVRLICVASLLLALRGQLARHVGVHVALEVLAPVLEHMPDIALHLEPGLQGME